MSELIDRLREGLGEAQKRQAEVAKRLQSVQGEWASACAEVNGYVKVIELETRREMEKAATETPAENSSVAQSNESSENDGDTVNKTQVVRDALEAHPGLTPAQLWGAVKTSIPKRTYVYSVLKRLKDRKQVIEKRGKYYLPPNQKTEEVQQELIQ